MVVLTLSFLCYKMTWMTSQHVALLIGVITALIAFINIAFFATCMQHCWKRVSATQFTLYMAISNAGMTSGSAIAGSIRENFSWNYVFVAFAMAAGLACLLIAFIGFQSHQSAIENLESKEMELVEVTTMSARL
jgi:PAT family beta-lactamase induction signal transducer AmpG